MSEVIVAVKTTSQTSEDTWERLTLTGLFKPDEPIENIIKWVYSKKGDTNTIQIHLNEAKEDKDNG